MVYRGKPSAACAECRKRRSRCDQTIPACGQCTKAGRICPGYRNVVDLMFHDESTQVISRHKGRVMSTSSRTTGSRNGAGSNTGTTTPVAITAPIKLTDFVLYQPLDDLGVHFFMSNYVGDDPAVSQLYYLPQFYSQIGSTSPGLQQSIMAAGLAGYAKTVQRRELLDLATKAYIAAIQGINAALSDSHDAVQDATLVSIILAAMYEMLIVPRQMGMRNCSKHLAGAVTVALIIAKRKQQTKITRKLLSTLVQTVIINSWLQHEPLPPGFEELKQLVGESTISNSVHGYFLDILMQLVDFRHGLHIGSFNDPMSIITKGLSIDDNLSNFLSNMPPSGRYKEHRIREDEAQHLAYEGYYHVYPQRFIAHLWNNIRSSRLRLHQVILRQCEILVSIPPPSDHDFPNAQRARSENRIIETAIDILATVPQLAGYLEQLNQLLPTMEKQTSSAQQSPLATIESLPLHNRSSTSPKSVSSKGSVVLTQTPTPMATPSATSSPEAESDSDSTPSTPINSQKSSSLFHILFNLYSLRSVICLPVFMKVWIADRIEYIESTADPEDILRLQEMMRTRPGDGFPVGDDEGLFFLAPEVQLPKAVLDKFFHHNRTGQR